MRLVISVQVACYAVVRSGVGAVRGDVHLDDRVVLHLVILASGHTYRRVSRKDDDACVVGTYAYLVFCANHTERVLAPELAFLDRETLVAVIEHGADSGYDDFLSSRYVRRTTNNRKGFALADINGCEM